MTEYQNTACEIEGLTLSRRGAAGVAVLNRPDRGNALTPAMHDALARWYPALARDAGVYCAVLRSGLEAVFSSGDAADSGSESDAGVEARRAALAGKLRLCWQAECFSKPAVSLIDGFIMGGAAGVTLYGTHRVAAEGYRLQVVGSLAGDVPCCGLSHALARLPQSIGLYLALTGTAIGAADAYRLGFATHCIGRAEFGAIEAHLGDADPVDPVLDERHTEPDQGPVLAMRQRIARYFAAPSLIEIMARLSGAGPRDHDWAGEVLACLGRRSPLALVLTDRMVRNAAGLDIRSALIQDHRVWWRLVESGDFEHGGRKGAIAGGDASRWTYGGVEDVPRSVADAFFAPLGEAELVLPSRAEMQAVKV